MANVLEVITGISQAIANKHAGGTAFGLKRETEELLQGVSIYDPRIMDGFGVQYQGDRLILKYHSEFPLVKVHDKNFETDIRQVMKDITKHIKEEYKKVTKKTLNLLEQGDVEVMVQTANRRTCYVNAVQVFKITDFANNFASSSAEKKMFDTEEEHLSQITRGWLMGVRSK